MFLIRLYNFIRGYLIIFVEGYFIERFINICIKRNIYLWDLKKLSPSTMRAKISIKGFKMLRQVAKKSNSKVKIAAKKGIPFLIYRHRKRYAIICGILIFLIIFWYLTSFLWVIEINGSNLIKKEELIQSLKLCGLNIGSYSSKIDTTKIQNNMMLIEKRLAFISIEIKGSKAIIDIKERRMPPIILSKNTPCNIIAKKDGIIKDYSIKIGFPVVKIGSTVKKGDLLVSGLSDSQVYGVRYVHSEAEVYARTWYEKKENLMLKREKKIKTGNEINRYQLKIFNFIINFYINSSISYANYDKIENIKELTVFNKVLPISIICNKYDEIKIESERLTKEAVINEAVLAFENEINKVAEPNYKIEDKKIEHNILDDDTIFVRIIYECIENIAEKKEITQGGNN